MKIDPTVKHPDYHKLERNYDICDDAFEGDVKQYVPQLTGQTQTDYEAYVNRAPYFNMVDKTVYALVGALTRKPMQHGTYTETDFPQNSFGDGTNFLQGCYRDLLLGARVGILVDVADDGRSYLVTFDADDVINWRGDGTMPGDFVMIEECEYVPDPENPYALVEYKSWRELYLSDEGVYSVRIWTKTKGDTYVAEELPPMLVNGATLNYIPFWVSNTYDNTWEVFNPPLLTQAKLNIAHFKKATDIAHYEHFMALPTFTIIGDLATYTDEDGRQSQAQVLIGSTQKALHLAQGSDAKFVEVSGTSHKTLMDSLTNMEEQIFIAGSRLLSTKKGVESAEALQLRSGSESAVLDTMVHAFEGALQPALMLCAQIDNLPESDLQLNRDFTAMSMDPAQIKSLLELYSAGTITLEQFLAELYAGEVVKPQESL